MKHPVTIIGLGIMGQRMLTNMSAHPRFTVVTAWDPDPGACARTAERFPDVRIAGGAAAAIDDDDTAVVYIACPPLWHREHAQAAFAAGKAVYCEKPLGVDLAESSTLVDEAVRCGFVNIVNFSLASAAAVREVEKRLKSGALGEIHGVDCRLHFATWPRDWQTGAASWLSRREQGGFTREVFSHWVYLTERLFGPATLEGGRATHPPGGGAETHMLAALDVDGVTVTAVGSVGGAGPELVEYTLWGEQESCRIYDWNRLRTSTGGEWQEQLTELADPRQTGYELQLDNAAAALAGEVNSMPDFEDALRVQVIVENIVGP